LRATNLRRAFKFRKTENKSSVFPELFRHAIMRLPRRSTPWLSQLLAKFHFLQRHFGHYVKDGMRVLGEIDLSLFS
jgi:hypothetical protein